MAKKRTEKKIRNYIKKLPGITKFIAVVVFLIAALGTFGASYMLQKNDKFELKGEKIITMNVGGSYVEPELKDAIECISFGRVSPFLAVSNSTINYENTTYDPIESPKKEGVYYIEYQTSDFKYSSFVRIRKIVVNAIEINEDGIGD